MTYVSSTAFRSALTQRAKKHAVEQGKPHSEVLRDYIFSRFLARVFSGRAEEWVLKGGQAMIARVRDARTTVDFDLMNNSVSLEEAVEELAQLITMDLGDYIKFTLVRIRPLNSVRDQGAKMGAELSVTATIGVKIFAQFTVDVVTGSLMTTNSEPRQLCTVEMPGIENPLVNLYPTVDHIADKICATHALYGSEGKTESTRTRDLIDLVVLIQTQEIEYEKLKVALLSEWAVRGLAGGPQFTPPSSWKTPYESQAKKVPACSEYVQFDQAVGLVQDLVQMALSHI